MIKIAIILNKLELNGITSVVMNYCNNINLQNYSITILAGKPHNDDVLKQLNKMSIKIVEVPSKGLKYYKKLNEEFRINQYDVMHIHGNSATIVLELLIAKINKIKNRIAHSHNTECNHKIIHHLLQPILNVLSTDCLACSREAGQWMFGKKKFLVLPNAINIDKYKFNTKLRNKIRKELNIEEKIVIGHTGRLNEQKNQIFLINLIKKISHKSDKYVLLLIGDGPNMNYLKGQIKKYNCEKNVILYGEAMNVNDFYSAMDAFAFPSKYEGLGISILEAQINGLNCIASTNVPKAAEITDNVKFISLDDEDAWFEQLYKKNDFFVRNEINFNDVRIQNYNIENCTKILENIYNKKR